LREEREILKKTQPSLPTRTGLGELLSVHRGKEKARYSVLRLCRMLGVSRSLVTMLGGAVRLWRPVGSILFLHRRLRLATAKAEPYMVDRGSTLNLSLWVFAAVGS
jgi:hypothetical protein